MKFKIEDPIFLLPPVEAWGIDDGVVIVEDHMNRVITYSFVQLAMFNKRMG